MKDDFIFGLRPVIEAIEAGKRLTRSLCRMHSKDLFMLN